MEIDDYLKKGIEKLFDLDKMRFNQIMIEQYVVEDIIDFAKANHPREFVAFLHGRIEDKALIIDSLVYNEFNSDEGSATPVFHFPDKSFYGSVHSHPSPNNQPSKADREFFRHTGIVNAIIRHPYTPECIRFFDHDAQEINVTIKNET